MGIQSNSDLVAATEEIFGDMNQTQEQPAQPVPTGAEAKVVEMSEIKDIKLSDSLVEAFVDFGTQVQERTSGKAPAKKVEMPIVEEEDPEDKKQELVEKAQNLVQQLAALLKEAKTTIAEMTTVGMIGTNQKFTLGKKKTAKKNGPRKPN